MSLSTPAQLAIAAAVILVVAVGAAALLGPNVASPAITPSPSEAAATSPTPASTSDRCDGDLVAVGAPGTIDVLWCPPSDDGTVVAFTMTAPADWIEGAFGGSHALYLRPAGGGALAFAVGGAETVDAWVDAITGTETYLVTEPQPVSVGAAEGYVMDVSLAPGADEAPPLFDDSDLPWNITDQDPARVWVVDRDGQPLMIVLSPPTAGEFDRWTAAMNALETIEWGP